MTNSDKSLPGNNLASEPPNNNGLQNVKYMYVATIQKTVTPGTTEVSSDHRRERERGVDERERWIEV